MAIEQNQDYEEKIISLDRVSRVVRGGRRFRFRAVVAVGDRNGMVGLGIGKGSEVMTAIAKGVSKAKANMIKVELKGQTIPHETVVAFSGARVFLKPASEGTGVIAGGAVRDVLEIAGVKDVLSKALGSNNKVNNAYATLSALAEFKKIEAPK